MVPLRTAFSVTVTGEPVSPGVEPRKCEKQLVAPQTRLGLFWRNKWGVLVSSDGVGGAPLIRRRYKRWRREVLETTDATSQP